MITLTPCRRGALLGFYHQFWALLGLWMPHWVLQGWVLLQRFMHDLPEYVFCHAEKALAIGGSPCGSPG